MADLVQRTYNFIKTHWLLCRELERAEMTAMGGVGVEGSSKNKKGLPDVDNSVLIARERSVYRG